MSALGVGAEDVSVVTEVKDVSDEDEAVSEDVVSDEEDASVEDVSDKRPESPIPPPTMEMITNRRRKGSPKMMSGPLGEGKSHVSKEQEHSPLSLSM